MSTRNDAQFRPFHPLRRAASLAVLALLVAGCSFGASGSAPDSAMASAEGDAAYEEGAALDGDAGGADAASSEEAPADRSFIVTGTMYMTVEAPIEAADRVTSIVEGVGGRIDARSEVAANEYDGGSAQLTLRIPADSLDAAVDDLRELGTVDELTTNAADVTTEVQDLDAQISTLRASTTRIEALLADATSIKDIITLEDELDSRQAELESLEARERGLSDQVSLSTIELTLTTSPAVMVDDAPRTFGTGLESGWDALLGFLSGTLVVVGVLLPWLGLAAVLVLAVVAVRRSRSRARTPEEDPEPKPEPVDATQ